MIRILFQGDSITDGNRVRNAEKVGDFNHHIGHSYVFVVTGTLGRKYPGRYTFINRGVSGDTVEKIASRWQTDTLDEHPDVLSLLLGINGNGAFDGFFPEGVDEHLKRFDTQYRDLLTSAREQNPALKIIMMEPFALPVGRPENHYDDFMKVFAIKQDIIRHIAEDYGAVFIPIQKRLELLVAETSPILKAAGCPTDPYKYWLWDGVHPTEAMHNFLAEMWLEATVAIL